MWLATFKECAVDRRLPDTYFTLKVQPDNSQWSPDGLPIPRQPRLAVPRAQRPALFWGLPVKSIY